MQILLELIVRTYCKIATVNLKTLPMCYSSDLRGKSLSFSIFISKGKKYLVQAPNWSSQESVALEKESLITEINYFPGKGRD